MNGSALAAALRVGVAAGVLALSAVPVAADTSSCPAPVVAGIHLELSNPHAGDSLQPGAYAMTGIAYDVSSTTGPGIDRVALFLDNDYLGDAQLGQPNTAAVTGPYAKAGFSAVVKVPQPIGPAGEVRNVVVIAYPTSGGSVTYSVPVGLSLLRSYLLPSPDTCPTMSAGNRPATPVAPSAPAPAPVAPAPVVNPEIALDGQTLAMQTPDTQALFQSVFGPFAAVQWAQQHNQALGFPPRP